VQALIIVDPLPKYLDILAGGREPRTPTDAESQDVDSQRLRKAILLLRTGTSELAADLRREFFEEDLKKKRGVGRTS
jgi:hypothetical protein